MASARPAPYVVPPSKKFDGNDGAWSTFIISIGTPGQDFRVLVSTQSGQIQVIVPDGCVEGDGPDCANLRGAEIFNSAQNPGFQVNVSSTWSTIGQYQVETESRLNITAPGIFGYDKVALGPAAESTLLSLDHQVVAGLAETNYWMGHIPLGIPDSSFSSLSQSIDSFIHQLRNQTKIPSMSFGYTAGAKYRLKSVFGNLVLGGYDATRFTPNTNPITFSFSTDPSKLLTVGVESITAQNTLKGTYSLSSEAHFSLVDSTVAHLWLPSTICDHFEEAFGLTYDPGTDLYLVNDTIHEQLKSKNPSITIKLVNSLKDTSVNYTNIVLPYAAFDLQASYPYYPNPTNYFPIRRAATDSQYVLGRTLLQEAYLIVDYERGNFTIARAAFPDPLPAPKIISIDPPGTVPESGTESWSSVLSTGAIAGLAVGGAVLLILIIVGAIFLHRKRRQRKARHELENTQITEERASQARMREHKWNGEPQELGGTPFVEAETPRQNDFKPHWSPTNIPQELPTTSRPRWGEVTNYYEVHGKSAPASRSANQAPSEFGRDTLGVSTLGQDFLRNDRV